MPVYGGGMPYSRIGSGSGYSSSRRWYDDEPDVMRAGMQRGPSTAPGGSFNYVGGYAPGGMPYYGADMSTPGSMGGGERMGGEFQDMLYMNEQAKADAEMKRQLALMQEQSRLANSQYSSRRYDQFALNDQEAANQAALQRDRYYLQYGIR